MRTGIQVALSLTLIVLAHSGVATPRAVVDEIKIGGPDGWDYATFDPTTHNLYIAHGSAIASVNVLTKVATAHLADAQGAHIAVPFADGRMLLITHGKANTVTLNDAKTGAVKVSVAVDSKPDAAIIEPRTGRAFVMANGASLVDVVDLNTDEVVGRIAVGGDPEAAAVDGRGMVFTHLEDHNALVVIDGSTRRVRATYTMNDCDEPSGIAFITKRNLVLSACHNGIARFTNADTGVEVAKVQIGSRPDAAFYDDVHKLAFVPCGDGTLTVIGFSSAQPMVTEVVTTKAGARTGAVDPASGIVYLPTADLEPPAKAGERPIVVPNTLKVLVIGS